MPDVTDWLRDAAAGFALRLGAVAPDQWSAPTPNDEWDVRALVAHLVDEQLWAPGILAGGELADIEPEIPGDPLGADPVGAHAQACAAMLTALDGVDLAATTHLSFGDVPAAEYLMQLFADHLIHTWDLARATGQDEALDEALVRASATWFADREDLYRSAGVIGPAVTIGGGSAQAQLLAAFGRDSRR